MRPPNWTAGQSAGWPVGQGSADSVDLANGGNIEVTIDGTENKVAIVATQNDTTNNPNAVNIINSGSGDSLNINTTDFVVDSSGNVAVAGTVDGVDIAGLDNRAGAATIQPNFVVVDPGATAVTGERYTTWSAADTYVATQTPSATNRWEIRIN